MTALEMNTAYEAWRRANGCDGLPSVFGAHLRRHAISARNFDHLRNSARAVSGQADGPRSLITAKQVVVSGNERGADTVNCIANGTDDGIDHARIVRVFCEARRNVDDGVGKDHGGRLFSNQGRRLDAHVSLRGLATRIKAAFRGGVD